ncbi:putative pilin/flagellin [Halalkaliarchaeum sp. AArc-CO]|uniref:DUF7289 family protein n=1 Tax=unclassified Halalkaliarchaeum TaxID=2678344 RepID=UPI00217EC01F|nr:MULTISPECIES: hypothetical protein [unclassified Halalkaliarchaeum]MDR5673449.1 hypothetical protein [Halalkaliarchaeum sp. AArc-GB]UWG49875.1 putative pilin/flagellin [Halalkaliarchaeum sp. AArc-CO]
MNRRPVGVGSSARAQSEVVGVALLLGIAVLSLGALTLTIGVTLEENAATADANAVATGLEQGIEPVTATGTRESTLSFTDGTLRTTERTIRVLEDGQPISTWEIGAVVYETDGHRVISLGGAVVESRGGYSRVHEGPPVAASEGVLLVGVVDLDPVDPVSYGGTGASTLTLRTTVSHDRTELGDGEYAVAVETRTTDAWERELERQGASTSVETFNGDDEPSVVARFDDERTGYVVVHDVELEVYHG